MTEKLKWKGYTGGGTFGQRGLILFFRLCNFHLGYAIMAMIVPFYMLFSRNRYLAIYHYFRKQFGFSKLKSFCKSYKNHFLFGQAILDKFVIFSGKEKLFDIKIIGNEYFQQLVDNKKGFIIAGSHVGNFEIAGYFLNEEKKHINAVVFNGETEIIQKNRTKILNNNNISLVPALPDMSHLFTINEALQNGEIVSMHADRLFGSSKSIECDFLRGKADFPIGAFALATSLEVEVLTIFCVKTGIKDYKIYVSPLTYFGSSKKERISNLVQSYVSELEKIVKQYPEQWYNYYEFWKQS